MSKWRVPGTVPIRPGPSRDGQLLVVEDGLPQTLGQAPDPRLLRAWPSPGRPRRPPGRGPGAGRTRRQRPRTSSCSGSACSPSNLVKGRGPHGPRPRDAGRRPVWPPPPTPPTWRSRWAGVPACPARTGPPARRALPGRSGAGEASSPARGSKVLTLSRGRAALLLSAWPIVTAEGANSGWAALRATNWRQARRRCLGASLEYVQRTMAPLRTPGTVPTTDGPSGRATFTSIAAGGDRPARASCRPLPPGPPRRPPPPRGRLGLKGREATGPGPVPPPPPGPRRCRKGAPPVGVRPGPTARAGSFRRGATRRSRVRRRHRSRAVPGGTPAPGAPGTG